MINIKRALPLFICLILTTAIARSQTGPGSRRTPESQILEVLNLQVAAWNAGNLEEFMNGYWRSPALTFFSGGRQLRGWEATLERYRKTYQAEGREMGKLEFSDLRVEMLSANSAVVRGGWRLVTSGGRESGGLYTLIFRRLSNGWRIVHDHTSSKE